ncbi:MAG: EamA family transporter [Halobacteriaceae archaeon]
MNLGIAYSIAAALVWGTELFILKRYFDGVPVAALTVALNAAAILWYLPVAVRTVDPATIPTLDALGWTGIGAVVGAVLATASAFVVFLIAIQGGEVSYVAPINKIAPVFVVPVEVAALGTALDPLQVVGIVLATLAVYVANYRPGAGGLLAPFRRAAVSRPARLALLSAAGFAAADLCRRLALQEGDIPPGAFVLVLLGGVLIVLLPLAARELSETDVRWLASRAAVLGLLVAVGEHVTSLAFSLAPASVASPIVNTQAVVAVLLGGVILGERYFRVRLVAAGLAVVGVMLVAT